MTKEDAVALYKQKRYAESIQGLLSCGIDPHKDAEVALYLALGYSRVKQIEPAIKLLQFVIANDTDLLRLTQCRFLLCYFYVLADRDAEAEEILSDLVQNGRQKAQLYSLWAYIAQKRGDFRTAIHRYRMAIEMDALHSNTLNGLGFLYAELGENLDKALEFCRQAVKARPQNASYLDSLGWVLYKMGKPKEALPYLEQALEGNPEAESIREHTELARQALQGGR